jgi:hypothetical protein
MFLPSSGKFRSEIYLLVSVMPVRLVPMISRSLHISGRCKTAERFTTAVILDRKSSVALQIFKDIKFFRGGRPTATSDWNDPFPFSRLFGGPNSDKLVPDTG